MDRQREAAELRAYAERRDPAVRERLVEQYLPLADSIARRFARGNRVPLDDLKQVAALGLIKAFDRFDPDRGAAFSSFAVPTIQGELRRYFRDFTWTVRPPRNLQEAVLRAEREREALTERYGRNPTARELAEQAGCTVEDIIEASVAGHARTSDSLDRRIGGPGHDDSGMAVGDLIGAEDPGFEAAEAAATVDRLLRGLSDRDRLVLRLRFEDDLTQAEIGRRVGCSQMHVSRILRSALAQLADNADAPREALDTLIRARSQGHERLVLD
jgi:RNA polymerase sigma-B factor